MKATDLLIVKSWMAKEKLSSDLSVKSVLEYALFLAKQGDIEADYIVSLFNQKQSAFELNLTFKTYSNCRGSMTQSGKAMVR